MAGPGPITVVSWSEFIADPSLMYNLFQRNPNNGNFIFDPHRVNVMSGENKRTIKVNTVDELMRVKEDLMSKPILLDVTLSHRKTENYVIVRVTTHWRGHFAVLINPLHPTIRQPMEELFQEGLDLIGQDKKFCLEFDLGPSMEAWYADMLEGESGCYSSTRSTYTRFSITNSSAYQHCFDCNALWCLLGLPCWLLSAPPYLIHRCCTVVDKQHVFRAPIIMRTPLARNHVVELIPGNGAHVQQQRQVVMNRSSQQQHIDDAPAPGQQQQGVHLPPHQQPLVQLPPPPQQQPRLHEGVHPPPNNSQSSVALPPPPPYAPPPYTFHAPPVTQQPGYPANNGPGNQHT